MHQAARPEASPFVRIPAFLRAAGAASSLAAAFVLAGCGNPYRPVVASISPTGPASQPQKYAVTVAKSGVLSVIDFSGDTVMSTAQTSANPSYFAMGLSGDGYILHCDDPASPNCNGLIDGVSVSDRLRTKDVVQASLVADAKPNQIFPATNYIYVTQPGRSSVAVLNATGNTGLAPTALTELPVAANPNFVITRNQAPRVYVLSGAATGPTGTVTPIQISNNTTITPVSVGQHPVYGVMNADYRRAFVMNEGSGTVSVINMQTNTLDMSSTLPTGTIPVGSNPVWADIADSTNVLAVLNQGSGTTPGSLSIINIPLCNVITNPTSTCDPSNPSDAVGFGTVLRTVPVGINPFMVSILQDQNKAYVSNTGSDSISVIDLTTMTKIKDIPVNGHPTWIAATNGNPTGKVYVICNNSDQLTIIYTDTDTAQTTTIPIQGTGVSVRMSAQ
ncbi:MAG: YncE family protein [Acidobacteria bacterium]|nr:YncE family protein [Acidobacteriota bacterium]